MKVLYLMAYWYTFSKWYILGAWFVTHMLNIAFKKLWLSPLIINAVSVLLLGTGIYISMISGEEVGLSVLNIYIPVVFASILMNLIIYAYRRIKIKLKSR
ncbi:hypothetical protein [Gemelliphila palaticanis]|uniref:Uncharacterized protein n=1 Tax=Gemelliphila palaticanis TaxID=81950 RepID=A0ABX2SZ23_9BACL|nr:hypothetical protein [Gemella palaticanis]MBF0715372.1 hypothetical protein [Gemella palaticanis]NYS47302.1 hypothetical protein [Gemella palaticanis]